ncbi:hypothetical protein VTO42DRAFT_3484 [Malbranchea cinnamomea]
MFFTFWGVFFAFYFVSNFMCLHRADLFAFLGDDTATNRPLDRLFWHRRPPLIFTKVPESSGCHEFCQPRWEILTWDHQRLLDWPLADNDTICLSVWAVRFPVVDCPLGGGPDSRRVPLRLHRRGDPVPFRGSRAQFYDRYQGKQLNQDCHSAYRHQHWHTHGANPWEGDWLNCATGITYMRSYSAGFQLCLERSFLQ